MDIHEHNMACMLARDAANSAANMGLNPSIAGKKAYDSYFRDSGYTPVIKDLGGSIVPQHLERFVYNDVNNDIEYKKTRAFIEERDISHVNHDTLVQSGLKDLGLYRTWEKF